jgi:hypothetical protein
MESRLGPWLQGMLPSVRRKKDGGVLSGLLDAWGLSLDAAKDAIYRLRRRGFVWQLGNGTDPYYADAQRGQDLNLHALDRGTRRLAGETDTQLWNRLAILPATRQFAGSAMGMKYLVEDVLGHTLSALTVYADDPQSWLWLEDGDLAARVEDDRPHVFSAADQADPGTDALRQTRVFRQADLDIRFTFWLTVESAAPLGTEEKARITELINSEKPAHAAAVVHFVEA